MHMIKIMRTLMLGIVLMPCLMVPMESEQFPSDASDRKEADEASAIARSIAYSPAPVKASAGLVGPFDKPLQAPSISAYIRTGVFLSLWQGGIFGAIGAGIGRFFDKRLKQISSSISSGTKLGFYGGAIWGGLSGARVACDNYTYHKEIVDSSAGKTFMQAVRADNADLIKGWISLKPAMLNAKDAAGRNILMHAAQLKKTAVVQAILSIPGFGFKKPLRPDNQGKTTYEYLEENGYQDYLDRAREGNKINIYVDKKLADRKRQRNAQASSSSNTRGSQLDMKRGSEAH